MSICRSIRLPVMFSALRAVALAALPALAAEGRIPVAAPMVIAASGKYIVTNNLLGPGPGGPVITIMARDVDLDLNGFVLTGAAGLAVISAPAGAGGADHVRIHNGTVVGGTIGIDVSGGAPHRKVGIEDVKIHDTTSHAIHMGDVPGAVIRHTEIATCGGTGILWDGGPGTVRTGTIEDNVIRACFAGISIFSNCSSVGILNNRLEGFGGSGITLMTCTASLVAENTVEDAKGAGGIVFKQSSGNKLFDNVVTRSCSSGIHLDPTSANNLVLNNNSSGNGGATCSIFAADGILVEGFQNDIQGNVVNANSRHGLAFATAVAGAGGPGTGP